VHPALLLVHPALKWKRLLYPCQIYLKTLHLAPSRFFFFFFFHAVSSSFCRDQTSSSSARFRDLEWTVGVGDVGCFFTIVGGVVVVLLCCSALLLPRAFSSTGVWRCGGGALRINLIRTINRTPERTSNNNAYLVCRRR